MENRKLTPASLDNLCRLGLCEMPFGETIARPYAYNALEDDPDLLQVKGALEAAGNRTDFYRRLIRATPLGRLFMDACVIGPVGNSPATTPPPPP